MSTSRNNSPPPLRLSIHVYLSSYLFSTPMSRIQEQEGGKKKKKSKKGEEEGEGKKRKRKGGKEEGGKRLQRKKRGEGAAKVRASVDAAWGEACLHDFLCAAGFQPVLHSLMLICAPQPTLVTSQNAGRAKGGEDLGDEEEEGSEESEGEQEGDAGFIDDAAGEGVGCVAVLSVSRLSEDRIG
eukprot:scaffold118155_cov19-Tisochrysis_lutea.AAC.1